MTSALNLACTPPIKTGIVTSLFDFIILLSNLKELLDRSILILSLSLSVTSAINIALKQNFTADCFCAA